MNLKETYNHIAEDWFKDHQEDTWWIEGTEKFISLLQPGSVVLDVGCGAGTKTRYLTHKGLGVVGVDFSEKMIEIARRESPALTFSVADMRDLSIVSGTFDAVFVQAALLHIPKKEVPVVIDQFKSKLKPGGYLYIAVKGRREGGTAETIVKENDYGYEYERFFSFFEMPELRAYLIDAGFTISYEHEATVGKTNWLQVIALRN